MVKIKIPFGRGKGDSLEDVVSAGIPPRHWALKPGATPPNPFSLTDVTKELSDKYEGLMETLTSDYKVVAVSGLPAHVDMVLVLGVKDRGNAIEFVTVPIFPDRIGGIYPESWLSGEDVSNDWRRLAIATYVTSGVLTDEGKRYIISEFERAVQQGFAKKPERHIQLGLADSWMEVKGTPQPSYRFELGLPLDLSGQGAFYYLVEAVCRGVQNPLIALPRRFESKYIKKGNGGFFSALPRLEPGPRGLPPGQQ